MDSQSIVKLVHKVQVKNNLGLHTRPATVIVKILQNKKCDVKFTCRRTDINAKSILSILMLAAKKKSNITITITGEKEESELTLQELIDAFDSRFGED